jgi:hypothetical protein
MLGSATAWVAGTHAGQATAAAIAAVVIGGTAVVAIHDGGGSPGTPAIAATTTPTAGLPGPSEAGPTSGRAPAPSGAGSTTTTPGSSGTTAPSGSPTAPGPSVSGPAPSVSDGPPPSGGPAPTGGPGAPPAGPTTLFAGSPRAQGALRVGSPGDIVVTIRNSGANGAGGLVATLRLPAGLTALGGSGSDGWECTAGRTATCTLDELDGGDETTVHVRVSVAAAAVPGGTAAGTVRATTAASTPIPAAMLLVLP